MIFVVIFPKVAWPSLPVARVPDHTSVVCLGVKVRSKIPPTERKVVFESYGSANEDKSGSGGPTIVKVLRVLKKSVEEMDNRCSTK